MSAARSSLLPLLTGGVALVCHTGVGFSRLVGAQCGVDGVLQLCLQDGAVTNGVVAGTGEQVFEYLLCRAEPLYLVVHHADGLFQDRLRLKAQTDHGTGPAADPWSQVAVDEFGQ